MEKVFMLHYNLYLKLLKLGQIKGKKCTLGQIIVFTNIRIYQHREI